jgi:exodeoxyribonuclease V gamma subunit
VLRVHRAERADALVEALGALLRDPLPDPLAGEVVVVPTRGMERWLAQRLSLVLGVCANVAFPPPRRLVGDVVAAASGIDPQEDPWLPERAVWPLLEVLDAALGEPWAAPLATHLAGHPSRRFASAQHLARLFARYELHRPDLVRSWAAGADGHWQAELWRRLREAIGLPSPAQRLRAATAALAGDPGLADLPARVSLFGLTRLPAGDLDVLRALGAARDVHLFLLHPSPALWATLRSAPPVTRRRDDPTAAAPANRLLASWGQDAREMQLVLAAAEHADRHHPVVHAAPTLLGQLQADVAADRDPAPRLLDRDDRSVRVHACHGRARQVEVLHDQILHLLEADPTLEPRDVIVLCPDIEAFAPLVQATFGTGEPGGDGAEEAAGADPRPPDLRVRLADRALRQTNPVLGVVARLLELASRRLTASEVLDLVDREPVRRRFRLDDDDLERIERWVAESGIRWGLDGDHRGPYALRGLEAGTWRKGLDRLLVGVTMTEDEQRRFAGQVLPLDDVDSGAIELAGRFAELVDRLQRALDGFAHPQPMADWARALAAAADALTAPAPRDAWQRGELQRLLDDAVAEAGAHAAELALPEVRALLAERLQGRPTRANFRTGHLTVCTLHPMRSVPHRVVCLLGLDDTAFPRRAPRDGDDLTLDDPRIGERDPRAEDRQMLLDALMAAEDHLIVTYTGNDERTNAPRPPAVPVNELLDAVERTAGEAVREHVLVRHPLQPFDPRNFRAGAPWSFDRVMLDGARALGAERAEPAPFLPAPLPPVRAAVVELEDLVRFAEHPVRAFLRQRLGVTLGLAEDEIADELPIELGGLEKWGVGDRLLQARLRGVDRRAAMLAEIARGTLPPGHLGKPVAEEIHPVVDAIAEAVEQRVPGRGPAESVEVRATLPDGRTLSGSVPGVVGDVLRTVRYANVAPKHRLAAWVRLLALTVSHPERAFTSLVAGRCGKQGVTVATLRRIEPADALAQLAALVELFDEGLREPLPIFSRTSAARAGGADAAGEWESSWDRDREDAEPEHLLVLGGQRPFAAIDTPRFDAAARRLWEGIRAYERVEEL